MRTSTAELWAIMDEDGNILYSRGGSSSNKKLLVYPNEGTAKNVSKSPWIKQVLPENYYIKQIYKNTDDLVLNHTIKIY